MNDVLFKNLDCISLQRIYININSAGIINDCSFVNFYGTVAVAHNSDVLLSKTYFGDFRPGSFLYLLDSSVSMTIENSNLNNVTVDTIGGYVNATGCIFTMVGTKDIFSLRVDFNIYAADSEFIGDMVLFSISGVQGHFINCTFRDNPYVVQAHHCVITITNSTLTQVQQTGITFNIRDCKLFINDSIISDNKPSEDHVFIITEDKCHIRMTRCLYTQNYFNPHFKIIEKSVPEIFDSEIIENNSTSNLLEMRDGKFIVKQSVLKYNFAAFASTILLVNSNSNLYLKESIVAEIVPENNKSPWLTILAKSSDITIRDSQISGTGDTYLFLYIPPFVSGGEHFLHVINSNLTHNTTSIYTSVNGPEVVFEHVLYQVKKITILVVMPGAVFFSECRSVRLSHCNFTSADIKEPLIVFMAPGSFWWMPRCSLSNPILWTKVTVFYQAIKASYRRQHKII